MLKHTFFLLDMIPNLFQCITCELLCHTTGFEVGRECVGFVAVGSDTVEGGEIELLSSSGWCRDDDTSSVVLTL